MAVKFQDYYQLLGVKRDASETEIRRAYRKLARKHHPDLHAEADKPAAEEQFKRINEAYEVLRDPEKRAKYDRLGADWKAGEAFRPEPDMENMHFYTGSGQTGGFSDFFEMLFGGFRPGYDAFGGERVFQRQAAPADAEAELPLTLEEAYHGGEKTIRVNSRDNCGFCHGSGISDKSFCPACGGTGTAAVPHTLTVKIPAGIKEGARIRLRGQGSASAGQKGDLFLTVKYLPHPAYKVTGHDLEADLVISPWQAVLGDKVSAATLAGTVKVTVPPMTPSGKKLRLKGKGLMAGDGKHGDHFLRVVIDIPANLSREQIMRYRELAELERH